MSRLILLDASVVIAALASDDVHHAAAALAISSAVDDEFFVAATTRAEVLIGPSKSGGAALAFAIDFLDGCAAIPVSATIADDAASLKAIHRALSLPDAISLVVAGMIEVDEIWTFDRRWLTVSDRVVIPAAR